MKYLYVILVYIVAAYFFTILNFYDRQLQFLQPFFMATLLVYFNNDNPWLYYGFAAIAGLFMDSFTGIFGLYTIIFLIIIFTLRTLQLTVLTSKNILTIILLTTLAWFIFWLAFWLVNFVAGWQFYDFSWPLLAPIVKMTVVSVLFIIFFHLLHFNFWTKRHGQRQSF